MKSNFMSKRPLGNALRRVPYGQLQKAIWLVAIAILVIIIPHVSVKTKIWSVAINPAVAQDYNEEIRVRYNILTSRLVSPAEVLEHLKGDLGLLSPAETTKLMYRFERYMAYQIPFFDEKLFYGGNHKMIYHYFYYAYQKEKIAEIKEEPFRRTMMELDASGYIIKRQRNMYHPVIDYSFLTTTFPRMSEEGLKYLEIKGLNEIVNERKTHNRYEYSKNVEKLLLKCDYFINRFPLSEKTQEIQTIFNDELWGFIYGNKEFESFEHFTGYVDEHLLSAYLRLGEHFYDRSVGNIVEHYSKMVKRNGQVVINDYLRFAYAGIQKNRRDDVHATLDRISIVNRQENFAGSTQYVPEVYGYRNLSEMKAINKRLGENLYKHLFQGWDRGYRMRINDITSTYQITHNRSGILSMYQNIRVTYNDHKQVRNVECMNYDFEQKKMLTFEDLFLNYDSQKSKIMEQLTEGLEDYQLGPFEQIDMKQLEQITNFVITNDGIETFFRVNDDNGRKVGVAVIELSYSDFYTIIPPDFKL